MVDTELFYDALQNAGIDFYAGVPDSLLGAICACIAERSPEGSHQIAANEGAAVALAVGSYLARAKPALVYMQNSGLGNAVNPLLSLADDSVYGIPMLLLIGWRGEPGAADEPQHIAQGRATIPLLDAMGIPHHRLPTDTGEATELVAQAKAQSMTEQKPVAMLVSKEVFSPYPLNRDRPKLDLPLSREQAIAIILASIQPGSTVVASTGMISRELFELREQTGSGHNSDFLTVGSMGHCSQIALGVALANPGKQVLCLDGDGAALMHMGSMATTAQAAAGNLIHVVLNNGSHDSVGGQPTCGLEISFCDIAKACGYRSAECVSDATGIRNALGNIEPGAGPAFIEVRVQSGNRADLGRPTLSLGEQKEAFMRHLEE